VIELVLPLPPSVNGMYRAVGTGAGVGSARGRIVKSAKTRRYEEEAGYAVLAQRRGQPKVPAGPLAFVVTYWLASGTGRKRDVDNLQKCLIDVVSRTLGFDDSRIIDLHAYKRVASPGDPKGPRCEVRIRGTA
jgi:Holliday junction resolvase RusA-like endonuclease